jgi:Mrp family chromosome partitioning ATPase
LNAARSLLLSPSPVLAGLIVAAHLCAAAAAALALPGWPGGLLAVALASLGVASAWSRALLRARRSMRCITLDKGKAAIGLASGETYPAEAGGHVSRLMVTLVLRDPARRTLLVSADMLDRDSFRALRIWALWGRLAAVAGKQLAA